MKLGITVSNIRAHGQYLKGEDGVIALLEGLNYIVFFVFLFEMLLKIIANGFTGSNGAYWNNGWNRLDFIIVMISIVDVAMTLLNVEGHLFRAFRVLRVLRPLRMIQFSEGRSSRVCALSSPSACKLTVSNDAVRRDEGCIHRAP